MKNLSEILPLYGVEHDMILSKMGDITLAFRLELPEIFTLSGAEYDALHQAWVRALKLLPVGSVMHKQDWFVASEFAGDFEREHSFLSHSSERFFNERPFLDHACYMMLTMPPASRGRVNSYFSSLLRKHIVPVETLDPAFAKNFESACLQFVKILGDTGLVSCSRLGNEALVELVNQYLVLDKDGVRRDLDFSEGVRVGEKHCELYVMGDASDFPSHCGSRIAYDKYTTDAGTFPVGFVSAVGTLLNCNHIYNQYLLIEDGAAVSKQLEKKRLRFQSLSLYARENQVARDATDQFLQDMVAGGHQPVRSHFNVLAWTNDCSGLQEMRNSCSSALSSIDVTPKIETVGAPQIFWAGIPGNAADFPMNETALMFAAQGACFLNNETNYRSSVSSFGIRLGDRITGRPLHVDISDEPMARGITANRNKFILGPSGSGKSFFTNHLLRSYYEQGAHIVMVDVGHSYKGLCSLVGGYYFSYGDNQRISFNPFYVEDSSEPDGEKKESIKTLLFTLWKKDADSYSRSEYTALSNALQLYCQRKVSFRSFDSFYEFLLTDFSKVLQEDGVKEQDFDVSNFLYVLRPYYKGGEFDYLLNATENLDLLNERFIVFELDSIKDHPILFPVVTIIIMEIFISKIRRLKGVRKMILIEEAWKAIVKAGMAEYIRYVYKALRKHFGEPIVVTQEVEDIISSEIVKKTIIAMSDCKILFDQSRYENQFAEVQALLALSDKHKALVLSLNRANEPGRKYKEVFISLGNRHARVYRVEVSPEEYLAYTTEEREKMKVEQAALLHGGIEEGIKSILYEED